MDEVSAAYVVPYNIQYEYHRDNTEWCTKNRPAVS